ncbi:MAG: preprotein translocase subunit YajC [Dehalococcoidales bacterium]
MKRNKILNLGLIAGVVSTLLFIGGCLPADGEGGFSWEIIIFPIMIIAVFYFLMIRPQRKTQKKHQELIRELRSGDLVITAGGIYGKVESVSDESVIIKIESGATMRVAINSVVLKQEG